MNNTYNVVKQLDERSMKIFDIIQKKGPIAKKELLDLTNMKLSTLNRDIENLINSKLVIETDIGESTGGRKPVLYDVNFKNFYSVGIDISRTYVEIVVINLKIKIMIERITYDLKEVTNVTKFIIESLEEMIKKLNIDKSEEIIGVGIGIVKNFNTKPVIEGLAKIIEAPVFIDNGANAAVIGEYYFGKGKDRKNICYINCGIGVRTGVISSGTLIRTINNSEDAFGHMIVDADGEACSCGNYGCIEAYVSITNITKKFVAEMKKGRKAPLNKKLEQIDYVDVCKLAAANNEVAVNILKDAAIHFGIGLANFIRLLNPELIILSGPLINNSRLFYYLSREIALEKLGAECENISFSRRGNFESKSIAVGAAVMVLQQIQK